MSKNSVNGKLRTRTVQRFGWVPDLPDARDFLYSAPEDVLVALPKKVDLSAKMPPVYDQGQLGSCTANAIGAAFEFEQMKQQQKDFMPSRLFIYYNERAIEGTIDSDSGAMIRDGIKSVAKIGVCPEDTWPYDIARFTEKPPTSGLHGSEEASGAGLPERDREPASDAGLPRIGLPVRVRVLRLRKLHERGGRGDRGGAVAAARRAVDRRPRRARGRLRRQHPALHRPQLVGAKGGG